MRKRSIVSQLKYAARSCFRAGMNKHSIKAQQTERDGRIYSYKALDSRQDVAATFGHWMQTHHHEVTLTKDITADHMTEYLQGCADRGLSKATVTGYASELRGLALNIATVFGSSSVEVAAVKMPSMERTKLRDNAVTLADRERLHQSFDRGSTGDRGLVLSEVAGLRVDEATQVRREDIAADGSFVLVRGGKGGRDRKVPSIGEKARMELIRVRELTPAGERCVPIKADSLNASIRRHMKALGMDTTYYKTTYHALRKTWATDRYRYYLSQGMTKEEAKGRINLELGHSYDRDGLLETYVDHEI